MATSRRSSSPAIAPAAGDFLHLAGAHAAGDLIGRLAAAGVPARAAAIYDQVPRPLTAEARDAARRGGIDVLALFSPRTARLFAAAGACGAGWDLRARSPSRSARPPTPAFDGPEPAARPDRRGADPRRDAAPAPAAGLA